MTIMINVVFISGLIGGGVEAVNTRLAKAFDDNIIKSTFITLIPDQSEKIETGLNVKYLIGNSTKLCAFKILNALKECKPDIILTCNFDDTHIALIYKAFINKKCRVIYAQHTVFSTVKALSLKSRLFNIALPRLTHLNKIVDFVIFVSRGVEIDYLNNFNVKSEKRKVIYNPITDCNRVFTWHNIDKRNIKLVTAGRLSPEKDQKTMIKSVEILRKKGYNVSLSIYGTGGYEKELQDFARSLNIGNYIHFMGFCNNLIDELKEYDIFMLTSLYESFGNVIVEAMSAGLPVISTDCPVGPKEIIGDDEFGILIPMQDPDALSNAVIKLLDQDIETLAYKAFNRSSDFSIEESAKGYIDVFNSLKHD